MGDGARLGAGTPEIVAADWRCRAVALAGAPLVAARFLTVVPVPAPSAAERAPMGWAVACFPIAGAALAGLLVVGDRVMAGRLPATVEAALLLAALLALTGALHLDGLMDSFDGLFGGRTPAARLAIMRDSRVGSYGLAAGVSLLLTEYGCLVSLPPEGRAGSMLAALALSRWAMAVVLWAFPAAGSTGLAAGLKPQVRWRHIAAGAPVAGAAVLVGLGWAAAPATALALILVALGGRLAAVRLGGITGDICGGLGQLVEAAVLVVAVTKC